MPENVLEVRITADTNELKRKLTEAEKIQKKYAKSIADTQNDISANIQISKQYKEAIAKLDDAFGKSHISHTQYSKALQKIQKDEKETQIDTQNLRKELLRLKDAQKGIGTSADSGSKGVGKLGKSTANAVPSVVEFSRIIQDAPYGIQGVANNIQQLSTNFLSLKKSAGGTIPALKAFGSSFLGPAGIVFAISTITSLLVTYGDELFKASDKTKKLKEETDKNKQALDDYINSLTGVAKSQLASQKNSAEEIITLGNLKHQIEDTSLSTAQRMDGIKKLRKEFPGYFENISNEKLLNGQVQASYDILTNSILKRAKATAAMDVLVDNAKAEFDINKRLSQIQTDLANTAKERVNLKEKEKKLNEAIGKNAGAATGAQLSIQQKIYGLGQNENELLEERQRLLLQLGQTQLDNYDLQKTIQENVVVEPDAPKNTGKVKKQADDRAKIIEAVNKQLFKDLQSEELERTKETSGEVLQIYKDSGAELKAALRDGIEFKLDGVDESYQQILAFENAVKKLQSTLGTGFTGAGLTIEQLDQLGASLQRNKQNAEIFGNAVGGAFDGLVNNLTANVKTGNKLMDALVSAIVGGLSQMLSAMISNSAKEIALKSATTTKSIALDTAKATGSAIAGGAESGSATGPGAIAAIPLMIAALVAVVGAAFSSIKMAHGGIVPGGRFTGDKIPAWLNSGEAVLNAKQQSNMLMAIANGNSTGLQSRSMSTELVVGTVLKGSDIYLSVTRAEKENKRFGG